MSALGGWSGRRQDVFQLPLLTRLCENVRVQRMRGIVFSRAPSTVIASAVLFLSTQSRQNFFVQVTLAAINGPLLTPFATSEQYLGSTAWVPLAANASLSRYLICHPIFGLKFASRINFILSVTSWSPFGYLYWGIGHGNRTSAA
jgi:hypothetical protein